MQEKREVSGILGLMEIVAGIIVLNSKGILFMKIYSSFIVHYYLYNQYLFNRLHIVKEIKASFIVHFCLGKYSFYHNNSESTTYFQENRCFIHCEFLSW